MEAAVKSEKFKRMKTLTPVTVQYTAEKFDP
jgi:hypothetical protein